MFARLFPPVLDNRLAGSRWCIPFLVLVAGVKLLMGFNFSGLNPLIGAAEILETVDGVPLSTYPAAVASTVVDMAKAWGLLLFLTAGLWFLALFRYRAMLPLATLLLLIEQLVRMGAGPLLNPQRLVDSPSPSLLINWGLTLLLLTGFTLSLVPRRQP
jgi:hypothetical protein